MNIKGKNLIALGYREGKQIGLALEAAKQLKAQGVKKPLGQLAAVLATPATFQSHDIFGTLANELLHPTKEKVDIPLLESPVSCTIYGQEGIEKGAIDQIETAAMLPVAKAAALMPDAHQGYGLPIGGVLATENAIIPYAVGVDIGCRMCMTIYDAPIQMLESSKKHLKSMLMDHTRFGRAAFDRPKDHAILSDPRFKEIKLLKELQHKARKQIGSSGGGNHFVEFGIVEILDVENEWNLAPGLYLGLLSHSGSRGFGATIAKHYTKLAMENCPLAKPAQHLAWLMMDSDLGQEYWIAMNLAGDYASACHDQIHQRLAEALATTPIAKIENHHNFAWKEIDSHGQEVIVHRKGATPAGKGIPGIIPGSMTAPGFIVRGKGNVHSLNSAAHGAGRVLSRKKAKTQLNHNQVQKHLSQFGVEVIGAGLDEAPMAYKDIRKVMQAQSALVDILGSFTPKIVRMESEA